MACENCITLLNLSFKSDFAMVKTNNYFKQNENITWFEVVKVKFGTIVIHLYNLSCIIEPIL